MSDFRPMTECKGFNMERVLLKNKNGYMITAHFKDGMLQCDGDEDWTHPIAWSGFIRLRDLANGDNTSDGGLHLQRVSGSLPDDVPLFVDWLDKYYTHAGNDDLYKRKDNGTIEPQRKLYKDYCRAYKLKQ